MRILRLGCLPALLLAVALSARAGAPPFGPHHEPPPLDTILERNAERLKLDPETLAHVRAAVAASRPEHDRLADSLRSLHLEMRTLLSADDPNHDAVMQLADRIGAAETALAKHRLATLLEIRAMLTPEQRRELVRIHEEHRRAWREGKPPDAQPGAAPDTPPPD